MIQNILIDLDGTLTDPKVGITTSARYGLEKVGHPISEDTNIDWIIGPPLKASLAKILNVDADDTLAEQALMAYRERFAVTGLYENHVFEGVAETLAELKRRGYRLFLATAKPTVYARQILEHFNLAQYFTEIYGSELNGDRTNKGELIQYILEQQGIQADQCIMVGDREHDIFGARHNGIESIAVKYGYGSEIELQQAQPKYTIENFRHLLNYLTRIADKKLT
ncbi:MULTISPECIES: HAD family hydrolase [Acinetobacter]|uniref:HAD family hydrolase n=1 Tax=Acinetobacter TaxID=469 RepID=UPI00132FA151|nr:HAD family hydrolase [Acinetobacter variabilis]NHB65065.1 HAD family hydrolase [Acinetobacter sp. GFQ9D191M]NHC01628.1 HAD family hydrolase [Acinetobacter sp. GFQ9D192M]